VLKLKWQFYFGMDLNYCCNLSDIEPALRRRTQQNHTRLDSGRTHQRIAAHCRLSTLIVVRKSGTSADQRTIEERPSATKSASRWIETATAANVNTSSAKSHMFYAVIH